MRMVMLLIVLLAFMLFVLITHLMHITSGGPTETEDSGESSGTRMDAWSRIGAMIPGTEEDLSVLRAHWERMDAGFGSELDLDEDAIRRCLQRDLPLIADTLEEAITTASDADQVRMARAAALDALESTVSIMKAHLSNLHKAACDAQTTVGRYLECRLEDMAPNGPLTPASGKDAGDRPALSHQPLAGGFVMTGRPDAEPLGIRNSRVEDDSIPY